MAATGLMSDVVGGVRAVRMLCHEGSLGKGTRSLDTFVWWSQKGGAPGSRVNDGTTIKRTSTASWWVLLPPQVLSPPQGCRRSRIVSICGLVVFPEIDRNNCHSTCAAVLDAPVVFDSGDLVQKADPSHRRL
jgi:hypothetical protein